MLQRALNTLRFLWVLCQAMVDGLTQWLDACTREHADMSTVLRLERYVLTRRLAKVTPGEGTAGMGGRWHRAGADPVPAAGRGRAPRGPGRALPAAPRGAPRGAEPAGVWGCGPPKRRRFQAGA